jgi:hypothetical protein
MFLGTYGSPAAATLLVLPILLYGRLAHGQAAEEVFSAAVDRPIFPAAVGGSVRSRICRGRSASTGKTDVGLGLARRSGCQFHRFA